VSQVANIKTFEGAAWFKDEFGLLAKNPRNQKRYTAPEALFNLDKAGLHKTIHDRHEEHHNNNGPNASAGTPPRRAAQGKTKSAVGMVDLTGSTRDSASQTSSSSSDDLSLSNEGSRLKASGDSTDSTSTTGGR
jgi:hypothetical protein